MNQNDTAQWCWWQVDLAAVSVFITLTVMTYFLVVSPVIQRRVAQAAQKQKFQEQQITAAKTHRSLQSLRQQLSGVHQALNETTMKLQPAEAVNQRLAELTKLAEKNQLEVNQVKPGNTVPGQRYDTVPIRLSGSGTYRTCTQFMHRLHAKFPDIGIRLFEWAAESTQKSVSVAFTFDLAWHTTPTQNNAPGPK